MSARLIEGSAGWEKKGGGGDEGEAQARISR
jgi:hypothetical protein